MGAAERSVGFLAEPGLRFADFSVSSERIPTNLLSARLKKLVACGLPERHQYHITPARYEYRSTATGEKLRPILNEIKQFGLENLTDYDRKVAIPDGRRTVLKASDNRIGKFRGTQLAT